MLIRLGGPVFGGLPDPYLWPGDPEEWARKVQRLGYGAAYAPVDDGADDRVDLFSQAAESAGIVIAEVGIWRNLIGPDEHERRANGLVAQERLDLADRLGARCAVTFAGTRGDGAWGPWGWGPCDQNFSAETFALVVDVVREIIDAVRPLRARLALETMSTVIPDSAESYSALVEAVDRDGFGVHFDPVNLIVSPRMLAEHRQLIRDFVARLGDRIVSCHGKDVRLRPEPLTHPDELPIRIHEVPPGDGTLDYQVFLGEVMRLPGEVPVMLEHLATEADYSRAAAFVRAQLKQIDVLATEPSTRGRE